MANKLKHPAKMPPGSVWMAPEIINDSRVKASHIFVFMGLCTYVDASTDQCFVSQETLSKKVRMSLPTVQKCLKELEDFGYISCETRHRKTGRGRTTNLYTILNKVDENGVKTVNDQGKKFLCKKNKNNVLCKIFLCKNRDQYKKFLCERSRKCPDVSATNPSILPSNKNNLKNNKNNLLRDSAKPSNIPSNGLFDLQAKKSSLSPEQILDSLKGKARITRKLQFVEKGQMYKDTLEDIDLCLYFATKHKEIVGYEIPYNKEQYMTMWRGNYDMSVETTYNLIPKVLEEFVDICKKEGRKKSQWFLKIGWLSYSGPNDEIARIMNKVKPKVNEKYTQKKPEPVNSQFVDFDDDDEVF